MTRRELLQTAVAAGSVVGRATRLPVTAIAHQIQQVGQDRTTSASVALTLARFLNRTKFGDLPPLAIEHAKMILASTYASAAPGSLIGSARSVQTEEPATAKITAMI